MYRRVKVGVVGGGWRSDFFTRLALQMPDEMELVGVAVRRQQVADELSVRLGVRTFTSPEDLTRHARPDYVIVAVASAANDQIIAQLTDAGVPVLAETPPATTLDGLRALWDRVGGSGRVQVAEQYLRMPGHATRAEIVRRGVIGSPTSAQISSTHGYHAVSVIRGILRTGFHPVRVRTTQFSAPLIDPLTRSGWTHDQTEHSAVTTIATLDFGGTSGLYDFTDNQWHNQLRHRRIVIRGSRGEIVDDSVVHMPAEGTIVKSRICRSQLGHDLNLDGYDTEHLHFEGEVMFRNPFVGLRLMDEEIAIASLMAATGRWARGEGEPPYPLAEAAQDQAISLAIQQAAESGEAVHVGIEAWASVP